MAILKERLESLSKTVFEQQFREDFERLEEPVKTVVAEAIEELVEENLSSPWNHPDLKYIPGDTEIWRLKVGDRDQQVDHRVFFDVGTEGLVFLAVEHRDTAYQ